MHLDAFLPRSSVAGSRRLPHCLARLLGGPGLAGRIALDAAALVLLVLAVAGSTSFFISASLLREHIEDELAHEVHLVSQRIEISLDNLRARLESMAANPLTSNSLTDTTAGRDAYLRPFLNDDGLVRRGASLTLLDFGGTVVSSSRNGATVREAAAEPWFRLAFDQRRTQVLLVEDEVGKGFRLRLVAPVIYPASGQAEGVLLLEAALDEVLNLRTAQPVTDLRRQYTYVLSSNKVVAGMRPELALFKMGERLALGAPYDNLDLALEVGIERRALLQPLLKLVGSYAMAGLAALVFVLWMVRRFSRRLTAPLAKLADNADQISRSGRLDLDFAYGEDDEIGRLGRSFGAMLERLQAVHDELESRVAERTRKLRESEDKLASLLRSLPDIVFSLAPDRQTYLYASAACQRVLGIDMAAPGSPVQGFVDRIHQADRAEFHQALMRLPVEGEVQCSFRALRTDGALRWLHLRMHAVLDAAGEIARYDGIVTDMTERKRAEEALLAARQFAQSTLDGLTAHICVLDEQGIILSVNEAWRQFGVANGADPRSIAEGSNYLGVCGDGAAAPDDEADSIAAGVRQVLTGKRDLFEMEYPCHSPDEQRWFLVRVSRLRGGGPGRVVVAHENITPRKLAENALRESEERCRFALEGARDGVWDWNVATGELVLSKRWKEILGFAENEVGNCLEEWEARVHPEDKPRVLVELQKHMGGHTAAYVAEYRMRGRSDWKWVLDRGMVVGRDAAGEPLRMLGTISDISQRKAIEAALQDRNVQLDTIFALSPDGFVSFDREGRVKFANPAFFRMTGIAPETVLNQPEGTLDDQLRGIAAAPDEYPGLEAYFDAEGTAALRPRRFLNLTEPRGAVLEIVGLRSHAQSVSKLLYVRDVTHETEVDRMKSEFLASAAHELRTPMASIYGFTELLLHDEFDADTRRDILETIYQQTDMLVKIINELLDLARIEARRGKDFHLEWLDPVRFVSDTAGSLQLDGDKWALRFVVPEAVPRIRGDRNKLRQALLNVLGNAVKYSPEGGGVELGIELGEGIEGRREIGIRVRDRGIGMTPEQSARMFERFYRADASGKIPGTGLGMSIVKEIVELHGGRVEVESVLGTGTEIRLWLPAAAETPAAEPTQTPAGAARAGGDLG